MAAVIELLGKEDALFFPSGAQANQAGVDRAIETIAEVLR